MGSPATEQRGPTQPTSSGALADRRLRARVLFVGPKLERYDFGAGEAAKSDWNEGSASTTAFTVSLLRRYSQTCGVDRYESGALDRG